MKFNKLLAPKEIIEEKVDIFDDEISFRVQNSQDEFFNISVCEKPDVGNLKPIGNIPKLDMFLQQLPLVTNFEQNTQLRGAYRVVFPEGATGELMKYKNGMLGTPIVGSNKKISAHAGLAPIENINITPVMVFGAMSAVTGQYFMARLDKSLSIVSENVKELINLIYDEKEADNYAVDSFYRWIQKNINHILDNEVLRLSTLTNIQNNNSKMISNIMFYSKSIIRRVNCLSNKGSGIHFTNTKLTQLEEANKEICDLIIQQHLCYELLCLGKICEMQVGQVFETEYCHNLINELHELASNMNSNIVFVLTNIRKVGMEILKDSRFNGKEAINQIEKNSKIYQEKQDDFIYRTKSLLENISNFAKENIKRREFVVIEGKVYEC